jgi:GTP-binding protein
MGDHETNGGEGLSEASAEAAGDVEAGRRLFAQACGFVTGAATLAQVPPAVLPEVAFAGRSNVGKSSLINALTGRRALAIVSVTPGRTRQLNFFDLAGKLTLVDLPGYGYAAAAKQRVAEWTELVDRYLRGRPTLRRVLLLIDARHGLTAADRRAIGMLDAAAVSYQVVLTKADKLGAGAVAQVHAVVTEELADHPAAHRQVMVTSARTGAGIAALRATLVPLTTWAPEGECNGAGPRR